MVDCRAAQRASRNDGSTPEQVAALSRKGLAMTYGLLLNQYLARFGLVVRRNDGADLRWRLTLIA